MKTPRRNFVVEYKTNRRQTKASPTSIWGNLDLRAVARAIDADGAMPKVGLPQASLDLEGSTAIDPEAIASDTQVDIDASPGNPAATPSPNETPIEPVAVDDNVLTDPPSTQEQSALVPVRAPESRARSRAKMLHSGVPEASAMFDPADQPGSLEELAVLEAENRHLKRLMVMKLREENDRLKSMLWRFGSA